MTLNKFKNIKIKKDKTYYVIYQIGFLRAKAYLFEDGKKITKTEKHIKLKTWKVKIHYRNVKKIEEV